MPFPNWLARANRRVTNRFMIRMTSRPPFAALTHTGRVSGRRYRIPLNAFPSSTGFVLPATYGTDSDWIRNLMASGDATLEYGGRTLTLTDPRIVDIAIARTHLPWWERGFLALLRVREVVICDTDLGRTA